MSAFDSIAITILGVVFVWTVAFRVIDHHERRYHGKGKADDATHR